jgi:hypothetical protein
MSDDRVNRLEALEAGHRQTFGAFGRPAGVRDRAERHRQRLLEQADAPLNPELSRRVYDQAEGTIDLIPGPGTVRCVAIAGKTGELLAATTTLELAQRGGGHGFTSTAVRHGTSTFRGVLSTETRDIRVIDAAGQTIWVPTNEEGAYWITVPHATQLIKTMKDGTERSIPFNASGGESAD